MGNSLHKPKRKFTENKESDTAPPPINNEWTLPKPFEDDKKFQLCMEKMNLGKDWTRHFNDAFPNKDAKPTSKPTIAKEKETKDKERFLIHLWRTHWYLYQARQAVLRYLARYLMYGFHDKMF